MSKRRAQLAVLLAAVFGLGSAILAPGADAAVTERVYHVAPYGNGSTCTASRPCSITTARDLIRAGTKDTTGDLVAELAGGTYHLSAPITLGSTDSGRNGHRVVWRAAPGETPILSGGQTVSGWKVSDSEHDIWRAPVAAGVNSRQFYVNGRRAERASGPASLLGTVTRTATGYTITKTAIDNWSHLSDTEFVYTGIPGGTVSWEAWVERRCGIESVHDTTVTMKEPCFSDAVHRGANDQQGIGNPTSIENNLALLTQQGQWYLDTTAHYLYYKPRSDESLLTATTVIPTTQGLLEASGTAEDPVHDITISGLHFEYDTWMQPSGNGGFADEQADAFGTSGTLQLPPGAVAFHAAHNVIFERNTLAHLGAQGLVFDQGSQDNIVRGNVISDVSANGIDIGTVSTPHPSADAADSGNTVTDNYLHDLPAEYHGGIGIFAGYVSGTTISHNEIARTSYTGISVGWGWGATSDLGDNHVDDNYIHDVMSTGLLDGGAIYLNGLHASSPRSTVTGNYVTGDPLPYGELYLDGSVSNYDVTRNVVANTPTNWVYIQTIAGQIATDNVVSGNYSDTSTMSSGWDPSNTVGDNQTGLTTWPAEARTIISNAGLEPKYADIVGPTIDDDVARGKVAIASTSADATHSAEDAIDGDDSTGWSSTATDPNASWQVDFGAQFAIDDIQLVSRRDSDQPLTRQNFTISLSNLPGQGGDIKCRYTTPELPYQGVYHCPTTDTARHRYLTITKTDGQPFYLAEVRAFGHR